MRPGAAAVLQAVFLILFTSVAVAHDGDPQLLPAP